MRYLRFLLSTTLIVIVLSIPSGPADAANPPPTYQLRETWVPNGQVNAVAVAGTTTYIGGDFMKLGPRTGEFVRFDRVSGQLDRNYPQVAGSVSASLPDGSGGWFIGGNFTAINGAPRSHLAHIRADGAVDSSWQVQINGPVYALAQHGGILYVGGSFSTINGTSQNNLTALDVTTGSLTQWDTGASSTVYALNVTAGQLFVGGQFSDIGGVARTGLASIDVASRQVRSLDLSLDNNGAVPNEARVLVSDHGTLYVGGYFSSIGGQAHQDIAAVDIASGNVLSWAPPISPNTLGPTPAPRMGYHPPIDDYGISAIAVDGAQVYVASDSTLPGARHVALLNRATGAIDSSWQPAASDPVNALAIDGQHVYVASYNPNNKASSFRTVDRTTGQPSGWQNEPMGSVNTIGIQGASLFLGGSFTGIAAIERHGLAALDQIGQVTAWDPNLTGLGLVSTLAIAGNLIYVGGQFSAVSGVARNGLAALNLATGQPSAWNPDLGSGSASKLVVSSDNVYVLGNFTTVGNQARAGFAAIDRTSGLATPLAPHLTYGAADGIITAMALNSDTLYISGLFDAIDSQARTCLAAIDQASGNLKAWNPPLNGYNCDARNSIAVDITTVFVDYYLIDSQQQPRIAVAAIDPTTGTPQPWNATLAATPGGEPTQIEALPNHILVSTSAGLTLIDRVSGATNRLDSDLWDPSSNPLFVTSLAHTESAIVVGGGFRSINNQPQTSIAMYSNAITPRVYLPDLVRP